MRRCCELHHPLLSAGADLDGAYYVDDSSERGASTPPAAQKQFADAESWRKKHRVDKLYEELKPDEMLQSQRFYPRWTGRRDKVRE